MIEPVPEGPEVRKEPPQGANTLSAKNIIEGPEVHKEPPQIDHSVTLKMYVDGAKNSVGASIVIKSPKGEIF